MINHFLRIVVIILISISINSTVIGQNNQFTLDQLLKEAKSSPNLLPLFGQQILSDKQIKVNEDFLKQMKIGKSRKNRRYKSNDACTKGWDLYYQGTLDKAMFRFNQSWLIDSTSIGSYIGFATIFNTLGDTTIIKEMVQISRKQDSINSIGFEDQVLKNISRYNEYKQNQFRIKSKYSPTEYHPNGQLFKERKKVWFNRYHWRWYHSNGVILREVFGGENSHNWKGEVIGYHDNGVIAFRGKFSKTIFRISKFQYYDREGNIAKVTYHKKEFLSNTYNEIKTIIYRQEIPWDKGNFILLSEDGWEYSIGMGNYPEGYISKNYSSDDYYDYYSIWRNGKFDDEKIRVIPDDCEGLTKEGKYEWFNGKLYITE